MKDVRQAVTVDGQQFEVAGRIDSGSLSFWLEKPPGRLWLHVNVAAGPNQGIDPTREVVALTHDDPSGGALAQASMQSGWFERTGRTVKHPSNEINEVWTITDCCRRALGLPGPSAAEVPARSPKGRELHEVLAKWIRSLGTSNITAAVVLGPNPYVQDAEAKLLVGAYPQTLNAHGPAFMQSGPAQGASPEFAPLAEWFHLDSLPFEEGSWQSRMLQLGFRSSVRVVFPVTAGRSFECLLLGPTKFSDKSQAAMFAWAVLNVWPEMKCAIARTQSPLSRRERECLLHAANGYTAIQTADALNCTERTVRHHLTNAMAKLGTPNKVSAIQRAQLMGIF